MVFQPGDIVIRKGETGSEMYLISRGEIEVIGEAGHVVATMGEGNFFGEVSLLTAAPRNATVRAKSYCDFFLLDKADFVRVLKDRPQFLKSMMEIACARYNISADETLLEQD